MTPSFYFVLFYGEALFPARRMNLRARV